MEEKGFSKSSPAAGTAVERAGGKIEWKVSGYLDEQLAQELYAYCSAYKLRISDVIGSALKEHLEHTKQLKNQ